MDESVRVSEDFPRKAEFSNTPNLLADEKGSRSDDSAGSYFLVPYLTRHKRDNAGALGARIIVRRKS